MTALHAAPTTVASSELPAPRGPLSESVIEYVTGRSARLWNQRGDAALDDPDAQLTLWLLNSVETGPDWGIDLERSRSLPLRALHWTLDRSFEEELQREIPAVDAGADLAAELDRLLSAPAVDLAATARVHGAAAIRDAFVAKAPYLGFEADPHTIALAHLEASLKAVVAEIQSGEYGVGHDQTHAQIFRACLAGLGLSYPDAIDAAPTASLAFANLAWLFGRETRWRGASVGQLCLFELDSVEPCRAQVAAWDEAGLPADARRWYDVHVLADAEHERIVRDRLVPAVQETTPWLVADAVFGASATWMLQQRVAVELAARWRAIAGT